MNIIELSSGKIIPVEIIPVIEEDFKNISKKRYFFDWKKEKAFNIYKLMIKGESDILGLASIEIIPSEWRIHIRLLTVSIENIGENKRYDKIIGNLIAFISKLSVKEFAELACVSLVPKTAIAKHYIEKYNMNVTGKP